MDSEFPHLEDVRSQLRQAGAEGHGQAEELLRHLEAYVGDETDRHTVREAFADGVAHFEADHPRLAATLQRVVDALTAGGI